MVQFLRFSLTGWNYMYQVKFLNTDYTVQAEDKENLLDLMRKSGLNPDAPCGGHGKCGKCKVMIQKGEEAFEEVLSCQTLIESDLIVDIPEDAGKASILTSAEQKDYTWNPGIQRFSVTVPPCPNGQSISDWTRFAAAMRDKGIDTAAVKPDPVTASLLGSILKETGGRVFVTLFDDKVLEVSAEDKPFYLAAFDIGTTTLAGYLLDGKDGREVSVASKMNPQAQYGADVINRANYTLEHGTEEVTGVIHKAVNEMLEEMAEKAGITVDRIFLISIAGNTCMHHLFLGISPDSLVHAPYNPAVEESMILRASDWGIRANYRAQILMLPNIAGFVGADTVACLVSSGLADEEDWTLLIDIGTNGEMVLGKNHKMAACSTAAGPAFEGAGITHGMRGAEGAISKVEWKDDHFVIHTIGDKKPIGICGSGLLDMVSELLKSGQMDETGELSCGSSIVLADENESGKGVPVTLEQQDIAQLRLAKAAIASGVRLLAEKQGIEIEDIKKVWLAGAFGSFLSPDSACNIGLIPPELRGRITAIGNAAGAGAKEVLRNQDSWNRAEKLARESDFLELAGMPDFQDCFVDELEFPDSSMLA